MGLDLPLLTKLVRALLNPFTHPINASAFPAQTTAGMVKRHGQVKGSLWETAHTEAPSFK